MKGRNDLTKADGIVRKQKERESIRTKERKIERKGEKGASGKKAEENGIEMAAAADYVLHYVKPNQTEPRLLLFGFSHRTVDL